MPAERLCACAADLSGLPHATKGNQPRQRKQAARQHAVEPLGVLPLWHMSRVAPDGQAQHRTDREARHVRPDIGALATEAQIDQQ